MSYSTIIIGAGFSGLSAASHLALKGFKTQILEKNHYAGGRAQRFVANGFTFDMGPNWLMMPKQIDRYFQKFGYEKEDFLEILELDPAYRIYFGKDDFLDMPRDPEEVKELFESVEPGSHSKFNKFYQKAAKSAHYAHALFSTSTSRHLRLFSDPFFYWNYFGKKMLPYLRSLFKDERLVKALSYSSMWIGSSVKELSAFYNALTYTNMKEGLWFPKGGIYSLVQAMEQIALKQGVELHYDSDVKSFNLIKGKVLSAMVDKRSFYADYFVASADYHHVDRQLLVSDFSNYSERYWEKQKLAPSALIFYIGIKKKVPGLKHHNLFFDSDLEKHSSEIFQKPKWPDMPVFYVCCPSKTDRGMAPTGSDSLIVQIPVASGLEDHGKVREHYYNMVIRRLEKILKTNIRNHIGFHRTFAVSDFAREYNAYKGNALGLLPNRRILLPRKLRMHSKRVPNLLYTGHMSSPGPGIPFALHSGEVLAKKLYRMVGGNRF